MHPCIILSWNSCLLAKGDTGIALNSLGVGSDGSRLCGSHAKFVLTFAWCIGKDLKGEEGKQERGDLERNKFNLHWASHRYKLKTLPTTSTP